MGNYYDRQGKPLTLEEWANYNYIEGRGENKDYRRIRETTVGSYWVSTVWIGIDLSFGGLRPLIFETVVFPKSRDAIESFEDRDMERYATEEEAIKGHNRMVRRWRKK